MKALKKIGLIFVSVVGSLAVHSQQDPMYTHYMFNTLMVNPGYAGSRDALTVTGLHRSQWVDFKGAPVIQSITMHGPLKNKHIGLGFSLLNDKIGPTNKTSAFVDLAYRMNLTKKSKLALGLSAGVNIFKSNLSSLQLDQPSDLAFQNNSNNRVTPNFGFGAYYSRERFYAGISAPNLLQNSYEANESTLVGKEQRHYFFIMGAVFNITENLAFKPTTLIKATPAAPIQADLTASFIIMKKLSLGAMYRTGDAFGGLIGLNITDLFYVGYSYD